MSKARRTGWFEAVRGASDRRLMALSVFASFVAIGALACASPALAQRGVQPVGDAGNWHLVMDSEFNGSAINYSLWQPNWWGASDTAITGPVNSLEKECYNPAQAAEGQGYLSIKAVSQSCDGFGYASDLVSTDPVQNVNGGGFQFTYGFMEAKVSVPDNGAGGVANWPAFWAVGQNWPMDGEIDVMEGLGGPVCSTFHYGTSAAPQSIGPTCATGDYSGWHTYGADWEPGSVTFYYDGKKSGRVTQHVTGDPMFLILDYALTNAFGGPGIQTPSTMQVAYVRVWQH